MDPIIAPIAPILPEAPARESSELTVRLPLAAGRHGLGEAMGAIQAAEEALDLARRRAHVAVLHEMFDKHPEVGSLRLSVTRINVSSSQTASRLRVEPAGERGSALSAPRQELAKLRFAEALAPFAEAAGAAMDGVELGREQIQIAAAWILRDVELEDWTVDFESQEIGRESAKESLADAARSRL